jgi:ribonuclease HI
MELHDEGAVIVYTDGSQFSSPRRGGIGIRLCWTNEEGHEETYDHIMPGYRDVTVPLMELKAVIEAVRLLARQQPPVSPSLYRKVVVYSDATYIVNGHPNAHGSWQRSKWHTRDGTPVQNAEQWQELLRLERRLGKPLEVRKVKGHSKNPHNKAVDKLAKNSAKAAVNPSLAPAKLRRKRSPRSLEPGGIPMEGQRLLIHIHRAEHLRVQKIDRYRFSVESPGPHHQAVGIAYAEPVFNLSAGHIYYVRFNEDTKNPRIEEAYFELILGDKQEDDEE